MPIPVGKSYSAVSVVGVELDHHCRACGTTAPATVVGKGYGGGSTYTGGASEARANAEDNAAMDAALLIRLAACPKCNKRDGSEVFSFFLRQFGKGLFFGALTGGAGAIADLVSGDHVGPLCGLGIAAAMALFLGKFLLALSASGTRVKYLPPRDSMPKT